MGRRKLRNIKIREERLEHLDTTKMEVAIWLLSRKKVENRTQRSQPKPAKHEEVVGQVADKKGEYERPEEAA